MKRPRLTARLELRLTPEQKREWRIVAGQLDANLPEFVRAAIDDWIRLKREDGDIQ